MIRQGKKLRTLFLLLMLGVMPRCGGLANPVLLLTLTQVPPEAARIEVIVTKDGKGGIASFFRDGSNKYVSGGALTMPPMGSQGPNTVQLALDLPEQTTGSVGLKVRVERGGMMGGMMPSMEVTHVACTAAMIAGKDLYELTINLAPPSPTCPAQ